MVLTVHIMLHNIHIGIITSYIHIQDAFVFNTYEESYQNKSHQHNARLLGSVAEQCWNVSR